MDYIPFSYAQPHSVVNSPKFITATDVAPIQKVEFMYIEAGHDYVMTCVNFNSTDMEGDPAKSSANSHIQTGSYGDQKMQDCRKRCKILYSEDQVSM